MSTKPKKNQDGWYKSGKKEMKKRKAQSPLENRDKPRSVQSGGEHSGHSGQPVVSTCTTTVTSQCKQTDTHPVMAYSNTVLQSPGHVAGSPQVNNPSQPQLLPYPNYAAYSPQGPTAMYQPHMSTRPEWAHDLIQSVNQIQAELTKLNDIDRNVKSINEKMSKLETKVIAVETKVIGLEESCNFLSNRHDSHEKDLKGSRDEIKKLREECSTLGGSCMQLDRDKKKLESKVQDLEWRSMKENLMFFGIQEHASETGDCSEIIRDFCKTRLEMDNAQTMEIDRAHRIGRPRVGATRPIVVKFHKYEIKERIRSISYEKRDALKQANVNVREQWPKEMMERRRQLYPVMNEERAKGRATRMVRDKLYINNVEYIPPR
jgi:hypothetical protein